VTAGMPNMLVIARTGMLAPVIDATSTHDRLDIGVTPNPAHTFPVRKKDGVHRW
jgi:hypothetical protein